MRNYSLTFSIFLVIYIFFTTDNWKSTFLWDRYVLSHTAPVFFLPAYPTVWSSKNFLEKKTLAIKCTGMVDEWQSVKSSTETNGLYVCWSRGGEVRKQQAFSPEMKWPVVIQQSLSSWWVWAVSSPHSDTKDIENLLTLNKWHWNIHALQQRKRSLQLRQKEFNRLMEIMKELQTFNQILIDYCNILL